MTCAYAYAIKISSNVSHEQRKINISFPVREEEIPVCVDKNNHWIMGSMEFTSNIYQLSNGSTFSPVINKIIFNSFSFNIQNLDLVQRKGIIFSTVTML